MGSILGIGLSGLNAAQAGLVTTGHNISNASTPGFNRQQVVQTSNLPQGGGNGFFGQGVSVNTVRRLYSDVLSSQVTQAQSQGSQIDAYNAQIQQLSSMLGDPSSGLAPALANFFGGVADVASHPESVPSRQALLSSANTLTASFRDIDQQMAQMGTNINSGITGSVNAINSYAKQIAELNQSILTTESSTPQQTANDLRDQRDALIAALNQEVRASVVKESNGSFSIFIGNGQPIVQDNRSFSLTATPSPEDPQRVVVGYQTAGITAALSDASIQGGTLGGLLSFRSSSLDAAQNALGRIALGLAQSFNVQHALGQDLNGALGGNFFSVAVPTVLPNAGNVGTATVSATVQDATALISSDYRLQYNGADAAGNENFTLTRLSDGTPSAISFATTGYPHSLNLDGVSLTLTVGATKNDSWMIEPTRFAASNIGVAVTDPAAIAVAFPTIRAQANPGNNATMSTDSVASVANMTLPVILTFNKPTGQFDVTDKSGAVSSIAYSSGSPISFNGLSFSISGTPLNGDSFTLSPNTGASSDNRNALALGALQTTNTMGRNAAVAGSRPTTTVDGAYREMVSQIGNSARQTKITAAAQTNVIAQAKQAQQSLSGVNLDEEAANLLRYQQAYQASGKMMQIASGLFQTVLDLGR